MKKTEMIIIGGGAAGLCAAISVARLGIQVVVLEHNSRLGKKISVSGNGKCNIGNMSITSERLHSTDSSFVDAFLDGYGFDTIRDFFSTIELELIEGANGRVYPMSMQSSSIVEMMEYEAQRLGVEIVCDCEARDVSISDGVFHIDTTMGVYSSTMLLIASGSVAAPQLGSSSIGYEFATKLGHNSITNYPSLVQLTSSDKWTQRAAGVKIYAAVELYANGNSITHRRGDILFTSYGISGLAVLDISREVSMRMAEYEYCELSIDLLPHYSKERLTRLLINRIDSQSQKSISLWLHGVLHKKLIPIVLEQSKVKISTESGLNRKEINRLVHSVKNIKLAIDGTRGWSGAEVATGGVDVSEVDPYTMESKIVPNLFWGGEVLDVDGDRGGYNLHFAWSCGIKIGRYLKSITT